MLITIQSQCSILTSFVSRAARRSIGKMITKKTNERRANPPAARVCEVSEQECSIRDEYQAPQAYHNTVISREYC